MMVAIWHTICAIVVNNNTRFVKLYTIINWCENNFGAHFGPNDHLISAEGVCVFVVVSAYCRKSTAVRKYMEKCELNKRSEEKVEIYWLLGVGYS